MRLPLHTRAKIPGHESPTHSRRESRGTRASHLRPLVRVNIRDDALRRRCATPLGLCIIVGRRRRGRHQIRDGQELRPEGEVLLLKSLRNLAIRVA